MKSTKLTIFITLFSFFGLLIGMTGVISQIVPNSISFHEVSQTNAAACTASSFAINSPPGQTFTAGCIEDTNPLYSTDSRFLFFQTKSPFTGLPFISTRNSEIKDSRSLTWSIDLNQRANVFIFTRHIPGQEQAPDWIRSTYTRLTNDDLSDINQYLLRKNEQGLIGLYDIYRKNDLTGTIAFQGASDETVNAFSMYIVAIESVDTLPTPTVTGTPRPTVTPHAKPTPLPSNPDPVIAVAGDIVPQTCNPTNCPAYKTVDLIKNTINPQAVLELGDLQYDGSTQSEMTEWFDPSWGQLNAIAYPIAGNHDVNGYYYTYFKNKGNSTVSSGAAVDKTRSYYSFDIGTWHIIALNSNCNEPKTIDCAANSPQANWLRNDLATHQNSCTLAYWHHPRYSSGHDGNNPASTGPVNILWQILYDKNADVVLSGHSHDYERFAPQDAYGNKNVQHGIRQFVVGTGGSFFTGWWSATRLPNSESSNNATFGVLKMTLHPSGYDWNFIPVPGSTFSDSGSTQCH